MGLVRRVRRSCSRWVKWLLSTGRLPPVPTCLMDAYINWRVGTVPVEVAMVDYVEAGAEGAKRMRVEELPDKPPSVVRIVIVSDTHERHDLVKLPSGADVLLHCGDILMSSGLCHHSRGTRVLKQFNDWLEDLDIPEKVVIGGNHDSALQNLSGEEAKDVLSSAELLHDRSVYLPRSRLRVYGNSHSFGISHNKAWQGSVQQSDAANCADTVVTPDAVEDTGKLAAKDPIIIVTPDAVKDADIVVTHLRSDDLEELILEKAGAKPKVWASGHQHAKHGVDHACGTLFVNAAILDEHHNPWQPPVVVDLRHAL